MRLASTTADLIPYPFGSGIEEQIPVRSDPSTCSSQSFMHGAVMISLREKHGVVLFM